VTWALTSRIQSIQTEFRITQSVGIITDMTGKADAILNHYHHELIGFDNLKSALPHGKDG
jgi:hypothetical protein